MNICVYAASSETVDKKYILAAEKLGEEIAKAGHGLVFGGGRQGLMGGVSRGALRRGAEVIGVAPKFFDVPGILEKGCTNFIYTDTMRERKQIMEDMSDAFIVLPGGIGTLEEFFEILTLKQLGRHAKPIAVLNVAGYFDHIQHMLVKAVEENFMKEECLKIFKICENMEEVLEYVNMPETVDVRHLKNI
ncbi:MAG: TIGR00730 family Rossman fold protein [Clostridia bacterium]|nr:TIGR00730 family Rossman fold protein [Clostridia bacterium]